MLLPRSKVERDDGNKDVYYAKHYVRYSKSGYDIMRTGDMGQGKFPEVEDEIAALQHCT